MENFLKLAIGGLPQEELLARLTEKGVRFNDYAKTLFTDPAFALGSSPARVQLTKVKPSDLGLANPYSLETAIARAADLGLRPCPLHLGAFLRLEYLDQPAGPYLTVASVRSRSEENYPTGFYLRNFENSLWLRGYRAAGDCEFPLENEFVFLK